MAPASSLRVRAFENAHCLGYFRAADWRQDYFLIIENRANHLSATSRYTGSRLFREITQPKEIAQPKRVQVNRNAESAI
jgi:hypothetical protein